MRALVLLVLLLTPGPQPAGAPAVTSAALLGSVDLAGAVWTRNGVAPDGPPETTSDGDLAVVALPYDGRGVRWATVFHTEEAFTARLALTWRPGPDGLLFEVVLDGERLSPPRDGWRPTSRTLRSDLGARWLGRGRHLLELVAREDSADATLTLSRLDLVSPR